MFCRKCGKQIDDGALFCPYCGQKTSKSSESVRRVEEPVKRAAAEDENDGGKTERKKGTSAVTAALIVGAVLILLAAAGLIGYKVWNALPEKSMWNDTDDTEEAEKDEEEEQEEALEEQESGEEAPGEPEEEEAPAEEEPEEETEEEPREQYFLPTSNSEYLTMSDLEGYSQDDCRMARNELYARHGRRFDDANLQAYFDACDWYEGTVDPEDFDDSVLNEYETANRDLIVEYEKKMGYR